MSRAFFFRRLAFVAVVSGPLLFAYLFLNRPAPELVSPIRETAVNKGGNSSFHPFGLLLGLSEDHTGGGEVLGAETTVTPEPVRSEKTGLLDRLISTFSDNLRVSPSTTSTPSPTPTPIQTLTPTPVSTDLSASQQAVNAQATSVGTALTTKNYLNLYNLMGVEFRSNYSYNDFVSSLEQSGGVTGFALQSTPRVFGTASDWAEVKVQLTQSTGVVKTYNEVFHLESSVWRLFGTEEIN